MGCGHPTEPWDTHPFSLSMFSHDQTTNALNLNNTCESIVNDSNACKLLYDPIVSFLVAGKVYRQDGDIRRFDCHSQMTYKNYEHYCRNAVTEVFQSKEEMEKEAKAKKDKPMVVKHDDIYMIAVVFDVGGSFMAGNKKRNYHEYETKHFSKMDCFEEWKCHHDKLTMQAMEIARRFPGSLAPELRPMMSAGIEERTMIAAWLWDYFDILDYWYGDIDHVPDDDDSNDSSDFYKCQGVTKIIASFSKSFKIACGLPENIQKGNLIWTKNGLMQKQKVGG